MLLSPSQQPCTPDKNRPIPIKKRNRSDEVLALTLTLMAMASASRSRHGTGFREFRRSHSDNPSEARVIGAAVWSHAAKTQTHSPTQSKSPSSSAQTSSYTPRPGAGACSAPPPCFGAGACSAPPPSHQPLHHQFLPQNNIINT